MAWRQQPPAEKDNENHQRGVIWRIAHYIKFGKLMKCSINSRIKDKTSEKNIAESSNKYCKKYKNESKSQEPSIEKPL